MVGRRSEYSEDWRGLRRDRGADQALPFSISLPLHRNLYDPHRTQVNGLATGLLGLLLLPLLRKTAKLPAPDSVPSDNSKAVAFKPHLTIVGSEMHHFAAFKEAALPGPILLNLNKQEEFEKNPMDRYSVTKLIDVYLALGLAALAGDGVVVNVVNPGLCESEFRREMEGTWTA